VISMNTDVPSWAVACVGPNAVSATHGASLMLTVTPWPMGDVAPTMAPATQARAHVMRQRRLAGLWSAQQGRSVFTGTASAACKAEVHRRNAVMNGGYVVLIDDVWGPDPWRPHPV
jgi:hypothetical protein